MMVVLEIKYGRILTFFVVFLFCTLRCNCDMENIIDTINSIDIEAYSSNLLLGIYDTPVPYSLDVPLNFYPAQNNNNGQGHVVWAAVGGGADLTCNVTSPLAGDSPRLVLWYKEGVHKPIYSYDMRSGPATHWKSLDVFGSRATFHARGARLRVERVNEADSGQYSCRVDFKTNPTLVFSTKLSVIVPPRSLKIYTENGKEVRGRLGPYLEGDNVIIHCRVEGGAPTPQITWWEGEMLLDMDQEGQGQGQAGQSEVTYNTLIINDLKRPDLLRTLTCHASNTNLTSPLSNSVILDINFAPLWTRILGERGPVSSGRAYDIKCEAVGGRPPPRLSWFLDHTPLTSQAHQIREAGNISMSELQYTPSVRDHGKILTCKARSPLLHVQPLTDSWKLHVYYAPVARLRPGRSLNLSNIEEGDDVYFECSIKANPMVYKIAWIHEKTELVHNVSGGVIISNQSLVLQRVSRWASGTYLCVAANTEGDGTSNPVMLRVKYAPVCRSGQVEYHGAAKYEKVEIPCYLEAHPIPTAFAWTFNNSGESVDIPQSHIRVIGSGSTVSYTPNTELDYGTLLCWGTNSVGTQKWPCVFNVFPAGPPDPVHNCSVYNLSEAVVNVRCVAGFDGGLQQTFIMELYHPFTNTLMANVTSGLPKFTVKGLEAGLAMTAVIYSSNEKGRGEMVSLKVYTIKDLAEKRTAAVKPPPSPDKTAPVIPFTIIAITTGSILALAAIIALTCTVLKLRRRDGELVKDSVEELPAPPAPMHHHFGNDGNVQLPPLLPPPPPLLPPPTAGLTTSREMLIEEGNTDLLHVSEDSSDNRWISGSVTTICTSTLPPSYATLPRHHHHHHQHHQHHHQHQQNTAGYSELVVNDSTNYHHHNCQSQPHLDTIQPYTGYHYHTLYHSHTPSPQPRRECSAPNNIPRRHSLRRDPYVCRDPPSPIPQKESSV